MYWVELRLHMRGELGYAVEEGRTLWFPSFGPDQMSDKEHGPSPGGELMGPDGVEDDRLPDTLGELGMIPADASAWGNWFEDRTWVMGLLASHHTEGRILRDWALICAGVSHESLEFTHHCIELGKKRSFWDDPLPGWVDHELDIRDVVYAWRKLLKQDGPPHSYRVRHDAQNAFGQGDLRRAGVDAGIAMESAVREALRKLLGRSMGTERLMEKEGGLGNNFRLLQQVLKDEFQRTKTAIQDRNMAQRKLNRWRQGEQSQSEVLRARLLGDQKDGTVEEVRVARLSELDRDLADAELRLAEHQQIESYRSQVNACAEDIKRVKQARDAFAHGHHVSRARVAEAVEAMVHATGVVDPNEWGRADPEFSIISEYQKRDSGR